MNECFSFWHLRPLESDECAAFCTPNLCRSMDVPAFRTSGLWNVMSVSTLSTSDHRESLIAVPRGRGAVGCSENALGVHWLCCGYAGAMLGNVTMGSGNEGERGGKGERQEREDIEEREERTNMNAGRRRSPRAWLCRQTTNSTHIER